VGPTVRSAKHLQPFSKTLKICIAVTVIVGFTVNYEFVLKKKLKNYLLCFATVFLLPARECFNFCRSAGLKRLGTIDLNHTWRKLAQV